MSTKLKPSVFSPPRPGLKSILKKSSPVLTPICQHSADKKSVIPPPPIVTQDAESNSMEMTPSSEGSVVIPTSFFKAINDACDTIQAMPLQKLINCFEKNITSITQLLTARSNYLESFSKSSNKQQRHSITPNAPASSKPSCKNDMNNWDDFSSLPGDTLSTPSISVNLVKSTTSDPLPSAASHTKTTKLNLPPSVEIIARPKPKESKLEADTCEGNAFLPLSSHQSKWGMT